MDQALAENLYILFNAGTHQESIKVAFRDYERLVRPEWYSFAAQG